MNVERPDCFQGLDIVSELIVSRCGFNPDDLFAVRACPGCGRQPGVAGAVDLAGNGSFSVRIKGPGQDPIELPGSELLYCQCHRCGSIYCVIVFGPANYEDAVITEYLIVREDRFLSNATRQLRVLTREGRRPADVGEWITSRLTRAINDALAVMDSELCLAEESWSESRYRKKWFL
ncbi:MAG: hypothetical protein A4E28_02694 [Methanocella sp. PtaU1.Bin125]|nr:MAG: hypothetical protein A4E28_02694 [Methanocella sp. PtaU1.Bin125]